MTKKSSWILMLVLVVPMIFAGCSLTEKNEEIVTQSVVASDFVLEVTTPTNIVTGEAIKVKGTLKYTGIQPVEVFHGKPIIRFYFSGSNEERNYKDMAYLTEFKSGQLVEVEDEFIVTKKGEQNLLVNIDGDISLTMNPIEILVK
ncbi:hypothetical protein DC345_13690 [Paenibacillus taichungensis]|uniref:Lipoprotein n=1 Tax=Paenibacillus taichungensis TaxID=484184 RepID=A0A329QSN8_9BACL|nr:hypothetical protein [Paenibacillus taichungensis]RAW15096.1 hypothetical protein DC345_13690 [Paenibacillus taichungensis]